MNVYLHPKWRQGIRFALLLSTALGWSTAHGEEIYRWVDESGRTHFSDTAPHQPAKSVTRIDSRQHEVNPEQRREAEARAANERARASELAGQKEKGTPVPPLPASPPGNTAASPSPSASDCASLLQRFRESSECYAPFLNVNGTMKPHAFETCGPPVPYPAKECS